MLPKLLPSSVSASVDPCTALTPVKLSVPSVVPMAVPATVIAVVVPIALVSRSTRDARRGGRVVEAGCAVADDRIVAAGACEVVEGAGRADIGRADAAEAGRIEDVVEVGAPGSLHMTKRIGADRSVAGHDPVCKMNGNARGGRRIVVVGHLVIAATTVDEIVASSALVGLIGEGPIVAAEQRVVGGRAPDRRDVGERVVADGGIAVRRPGEQGRP